jgi:hypothetical protein
VKRERDRHEPLDTLAEFLVEDILSMSDDQLLAEVTDDCGAPDALAAEFDSIVSPVVSEHNTSAVKQRLSIAANNNPRQADREADPLADFMVEDILDVDRFDGLWLVDIVCRESERGESPYEHKFFATISNGVLRGQVGPQAKPGGAAYDGTIESDGSMVVIAKGITGPTYRPKPNADYIYQLGGRLEGSQGSAIRLDRTCDVRFAKQPAGAGPMVAPAVAASPAAGGPVHRFDGLWTTTVVCEPTADALGWSNKFVAQVNDSTFQGHLGTEGKPGSATFDGTIKPSQRYLKFSASSLLN